MPTFDEKAYEILNNLVHKGAGHTLRIECYNPKQARNYRHRFYNFRSRMRRGRMTSLGPIEDVKFTVEGNDLILKYEPDPIDRAIAR